MPTALCPLSAQTQFDAAGRPLVGGRLYVLDAATTAPAMIYAAPDKSATRPNPVILTGTGRVPAIYFDSGMFDLRITDAAGGMIDFIPGIEGGAADADPTATADVPLYLTGDLKPSLGTSAQTGWVRGNGRTIGNAQSGATELASDDASGLFQLLWSLSAFKSTVSNGAGTTALGDFQAGKTISLPDLRGRAMFGLDGMGAGAAGLLTALTTATPDQVGTPIGAEGTTLMIGNMPAHTHTGTAAAAGGHTHPVVTETAGSHVHNVSVGAVGDHAHGATMDSQGVHAHTASTDSQGAHQHNGSTTDSQGTHSHTGHSDTTGYHQHGTYGFSTTEKSGGGTSFVVANANATIVGTQGEGNHSHVLAIDSAGAHAHTPNLVTDGLHSHNVSVASSGGHIHNVSVGAAGGHAHTATVDAQGSHIHVVDVTGVPDHTHALNLASVGSGTAVSRMPLGFLGTWFIKL